MKKNNCPVCSGDKSITVFQKARIANIRRSFKNDKPISSLFAKMNTDLCLNCGMLYRNPLLNDEEQKNYYSHEYYEVFKPKKEEVGSYIEKFNKRRRGYLKHFRFLFRCGVSLTEKRILDIGCGPGFFLQFLSEYNPIQLLGIEPSIKICEDINKNNLSFKVKCGSFDSFNEGTIGKFDIVTSTGVFEHLSNPVEALVTFSNFMTDDGILYIYTANEQPNIHINIKKRVSLVHQLYFTRKTMKYCLIEAGLEAVKIYTLGTEMFVLAKKKNGKLEKPQNISVNARLLIFRFRLFKALPISIYKLTEFIHNRYSRVINSFIDKRYLLK